MNVVYVTGNENKARLFNEMLGIELEHVSVEVDEIQSLDVRKVVEHKVRAAYKQLGIPVIVEDTTLVFSELGALPGPLIKWFLEELKTDGLCRLLEGRSNRAAIAGSAIAFYDGKRLEIFSKEVSGTIAHYPRGSRGWGWDQIFIPHWSKKTDAEMNEAEYREFYKAIKPFDELRSFLEN